MSLPTEITPSVLEAARELRRLQQLLDIDSVSATWPTKAGMITMRWSGELLELEHENGSVLLLDAEAVAG